MMLPTKRQRTHTDVTDLLAIASYADHATVAVVQFRFSSTHSTPLIHEARPHIARDVLCQLIQRLSYVNTMQEAKINEVRYKEPRRRHVAVRERE